MADLLDTPPIRNTIRERIDAEFSSTTAPAADPSAYTINWNNGRTDGIEPGPLAALDTSLRDFAKAVGLPAHVGGSVLQTAIDDMRRYNEMSETEQAIYTSSQKALLARIVPGEAPEKVIAAAETVLKRADPQFVKDLREQGFFASAAIVAQLYIQAQRDALRGQR